MANTEFQEKYAGAEDPQLSAGWFDGGGWFAAGWFGDAFGVATLWSERTS